MRKSPQLVEEGSLAVVLLVAIVLAGAIGALFITVDTGVDTARRDRDWHGAINAADAGIQEAVTVIRADDVEDACPGGICSGMLSDGGSYVATYEETDLGWQVCSEGEFNGIARVACADFDLNMLVGGAGVIGLDRVRIDGSAPGINDPIIIGTAGVFEGVSNACDKIEEVEIYEPSDADNPCPGLEVNRSSRTFPNLAEEAFTTGVCSGPDANIWTAYPSQPHPDDDRDPWVYGQTYCVNLVDIPKNVDIELVGNPNDGAVKVFVDPGDTASAAAKYAGNGQVNTQGVGDPLKLQFYIRRGFVDLDMKGVTSMRAIWYAPDSACDVRGTPTFTGAVVCRDARLGGNVDFIVPDDIRTLRAGPTILDRWFEQ